MAEQQAIKKLEERLHCAVCLDVYTDPKQLQCHHVYCLKCLEGLVVRDQQGQFSLTCPTCRQVTPVPANGVAGFDSSFQVNQLLEIMQEYSKAKDIESDAEKDPTPRDKIPQCSQHRDKELEFYCETCGLLICYKCAVNGGNHYNHDYSEVSVAFEKYKEDVVTAMQPMEEQLATFRAAIGELNACYAEISTQQAALKADINEAAGVLHESIDVGTKQLTAMLNKVTEKKLSDVAVQINRIETNLAQSSSLVDAMKTSLQTKDLRKALSGKWSTLQRARVLMSSIQPAALQPSARPDLMFSSSTARLGDIYGKLMQCCVIGDGLNKAMVGVPSTFTLTIDAVFRFDDGVFSHSSPTCVLAADEEGDTGKVTRVNGRVRSRWKQFSISYTPIVEGWHKLYVQFEEKDIGGSPFRVEVFPNNQKYKKGRLAQLERRSSERRK